jgi:hypothetical protein
MVLGPEEPTLRDMFAAAALTGLLSRAVDFAGEPEDLADLAFEQADAMIAARGKKPRASDG